MADRIQQRRDTAARWAQYNPILLEGEVGYVTDDPNQYKIGDGVHTWNELPLRGFDGTLVHELGDSQTAAMSQQGVTKVNDNAYIRDAISVANAVVINTVETAEIGVEIEWVNTGKVLRDDGTLSDNSGLKTSDYISCLDNKTPIALIGSFISYDKGFANVAYYTEDENHSFLCAFNIKSARFAVIPGVCARISIRNADTARFSSINIVQNVTLAKFSDIVSNLGDNKLSVYSEFDVGDIIEPDEIITSHWINGSGNVVSINSENFTVYKYNVENLPPTFAVRGKVGAQSASSAFVFTNKENVDYDVIYREAIAENTYPDYNRMVVTPYDAKYFYLARYKNSGIGLNLMAAYNIAFKTNKSDIGYAVMDYASVMKGYYIGSGGVLTEIQSNNYRVNIYEVTHLRGKEIAIDGEFGAEAAITPYAFSDNDTDIYTAQTFDNMPSGAPHRFYKKERVSVPLQASYLFIMNYVPYGPVKVYSIVEKTGDNHIDDTQRIEQIEKFTGMLVKMTPQETKTSYFLNASKQPTLLADGGAPKWRVLVYDVSQLDKVYLKGTIDSSAESYAYAFSTNAETVDGDGFRLNDAGGNNMSWKFDDYVYIPEGAKYLFLSSYDSGGDVLYAYSLSTDNALDRGSSSIKLLDSDVLICPIYGQSLAVGGEAYPFISKKIKYPGYELGRTMDSVSTTGVGNNTEWAYYGLIEGLISSYCDNHRINYTQLATRISSWCWGRGETSVNSFVKGTELYNTLISYIEEAYEAALSKGYAVAKVPAVTYVQGEADLLNPSAYKAAILQMQADLNTDIKAITGQTEDVALVLYQTNQLSLYGGITPNDFEQTKAQVPTAQYELIRDNEDFVASTPIYWMTFYNEHIHIDGYSQKMAGCMYGRAIFNLIEGRNTKGLIPTSIDISENDVILTYNVPSLPLVIDTHTVSKVDDNYGYNVVKSDNTSILQSVEVKREKVILHCSEPPLGCKVRYGINGTTDKSGWENGARGNIRDSSIIPADIDGKEIILHNWAYMFDEVIEDG